MAIANMNLIGAFVTKLWPVQSLALECGGGGDGGADGGATKNIIITTLFCKQIYRYLPLYISYI